ncbi:MAG: tRNA lysidine(34) synthetase TilS [Bacteroidetes bacterium]|nr:MAG: tRNA lysidine(34) synthetase TilS [Bacteroidota bacterium]
MNLLQMFQDYIRSNGLVKPGQRILVAVSGGIDSVVLAHLFRQSNYTFGIAHCNFRLRGTESDDDESFVRSLGTDLQVPVFVHHFDTKQYAAQEKLSTQMAARELRYRWFEVIREAEDFDVVATGHNCNDSVETTLLHFIRGTGLSGLSGIPVQNNHIIRPLLFAKRSDIRFFAEANDVSWREDSSNAQDTYTRNAIRLHIIPKMEQINPAFIDGAAQTMEHLRSADLNLQFLLSELLGQPDATGLYRIQKSRLESLPVLEAGLFDLLQPFGFSSDQARQVAGCWSTPGKSWETDSGYRLVMDRSALLLTNKEQPAETATVQADDLLVRLPDGSKLILVHSGPDTPFPQDQHTILVDVQKLQFPLQLRHWQPGDTFQPFGLQGKHQKLQDFFTNQKLSRLEKDKIWILEDNSGTIVWVAGFRLDERYKVDKKSTQLLRISWLNE